MNFFERRRWKKIVKHLHHDARHARHMREDIVAPEHIERLKATESELQDAWQKKDKDLLEAVAEKISAQIEKVFPPKPHPKIRENIEILAVAITVAMGFRTYFVQPFKIPTGSMQPTLYGITVDKNAQKTWYDAFPFKLVPMALFGERYIEVKAKNDGYITPAPREYQTLEDSYVFLINGRAHAVKRDMMIYFTTGTFIQKGQVIASGRLRLGDHIFVNKVRYNFVKPKRGDIFVFSTGGIKYPRIRPDSFYIKRLVGLPDEEIALDPPYLVVNGQRIEEPYPFKRLLTEEGYNGYQYPRSDASVPVLFRNGDDRFKLSSTEYLPFGDNTLSSLDGRYFGGVERKNIVGPAFAVYWPFGSRWGLTR